MYITVSNWGNVRVVSRGLAWGRKELGCVLGSAISLIDDFEPVILPSPLRGFTNRHNEDDGNEFLCGMF